MKIIVFGAGGFIGPHLVSKLREEVGHDNVHPLNRLHCDLCQFEKVQDIILKIKPEAIVNLAGLATIRPVKFEALLQANTVSVRNILVACDKLSYMPRFVTCSSSYVYPKIDAPIPEEISVSPQNEYGVSKVASEYVVLYRKWNVVPTIARLFNIVGVGQSEEFLFPKILSAIEKRANSPDLRDLNPSRDYVDVRDVCQMFWLTLRSSLPPIKVNYCNGESVSVARVCELAEIVTGHTFEKLTVERQDWTLPKLDYTCGDNSKLRKMGYARRYSLSETIHWMHSETHKKVFRK